MLININKYESWYGLRRDVYGLVVEGSSFFGCFVNVSFVISFFTGYYERVLSRG